jgi:acetyltransferase-like isoleucine patch superfamily enzyme
LFKNINESISNIDKMRIFSLTFRKLIKGFMVRYRFGSVRGPLLFIGKHVNLLNVGSVTCGKNVKIEDFSEIQGLSTNGLHFGDNVTIGRYTMIRPSSYYGVGNIGWGIKMGNNSSIGPFGYIGCAGSIEIGDNVMIGPRVSLFAENHVFSDENRTIKSQGTTNKGITIESNCWIGSGVTILDGVVIGSGSVIGAGSLITKNVAKNSIIYDKRNRQDKIR